MTTKILTGTYSAGYTLEAPITTLSVAAGGYVGGTGVATPATATSTYTVINDGRIIGADNPGLAGVYLAAGGVVANGGLSDTAATIAGYRGVDIDGARGTVTNYGTIEGLTRSAVRLGAGGAVSNGARHDTRALIDSGLAGVSIDVHGRVDNYGTILGGVQFIYLANGVVVNGPHNDTAASIISDGTLGVYFAKGAGRVSNYGRIQVAAGPGVFLGGGGRVINGDSDDTTASILGSVGVDLAAGGRVVNFGEIQGGGQGVTLAAVGAVVNDGVILGGGQTGGVGVALSAGGAVRNGDAGHTTALISGYDGVYLGNRGTVVNDGTIEATGGHGQQPPANAAAPTPGVGVFLSGVGGFSYFENGSAGDTGAITEGYVGIVGTSGYAVVTNFGTIIGTSGLAVKLAGTRSTLVLEGSCVFDGAVEGGGGALDLDRGTDIVNGLDGGGDLTFSDGASKQTFEDFASLLVAKGGRVLSPHASKNQSGGTIASIGGTLTLGVATSTFVNAGALGTLLTGPDAIADARVTVKGSLRNTGDLFVEGGTLTVTGAATSTGYVSDLLGTLAFEGAFTGDILFQSGSTLYLADSQGYQGTLNDDEYVFTDQLDLGDIGFVNSGEAKLSGDILTVSDGTHTARLTLGEQFIDEAVTFVSSSDGHGGVVVTATGQREGASIHGFVAAMAGMTDPSVAALHTVGHAAPFARPAMVLGPRCALA
jgi:hypothetical protein